MSWFCPVCGNQHDTTACPQRHHHINVSQIALRSGQAIDTGEIHRTPLLAEIKRLAADNARLTRELEHRRSVMGCLPFCPDHRDKVSGKECRECEVERLTRELSEAREAIEKAPIETDGSGCYKGRALEWFNLPAVRAAVEEDRTT